MEFQRLHKFQRYSGYLQLCIFALFLMYFDNFVSALSYFFWYENVSGRINQKLCNGFPYFWYFLDVLTLISMGFLGRSFWRREICISTHRCLVSENAPFITNTLLILLMSAFFLQKFIIFGKNSTFT